MMKYIILILLVIILPNIIKAESIFTGISPNEKNEYYIRLKNGDELSGFIIELIDNKDDGQGIKVKTEIGKAIIYDFQIAELRLKSELYRHNNRLYLMNTAEPIQNNHFIGNYEFLLLYAGIGIVDIASINLGTGLIPGQNSSNFTNVNVKFTVLTEPYDQMDGKMSLAFGTSYTNFNTKYQSSIGAEFLHFYGVSTFSGRRSNLSLGIFYKSGMKDLSQIRVFDNIYNINYPDGSFGLNIGLDTRFTERNDLHFIGELWNNDISRPTNTGVLLGLRLCNTRFSSDFGLAFFTQPFVAPFFSFAWTPL